MPISNHVKQACKLTESILAAVAFADIYSKEAKELTIVEVQSLLADEEPGKIKNVLQAYLELLQEG